MRNTLLAPAGLARLDDALAHIEANPEEWDQTSWECGTAACLLGRVVLNAHGAPWLGEDWADAAAELLGCDRDLLWPISMATNTMDVLRVHRAVLAGEHVVAPKGAALAGICLREVNLHGAILREVRLENADMLDTDLRGADLNGADLTGADLRRSDLRSADLRGALLHETALYGADLRDADLRGAGMRTAGLNKEDLLGARLNGATLPEELQ
jgi:uncharacterized protein YjbI with pentapeptide repeats